MSPNRVVTVRHGETEWSQSGQHTSFTDLPLLPIGRERATKLAEPLSQWSFELVLCSPLRRARETCELAGFGEEAVDVEELREWNYGEYEGLTTPQIRELRPDWVLWRDGCPGGESPDDVRARVDSVLTRLEELTGDVVVFAHGHILRVLAARWIGLEVRGGGRLVLSPGSISVLGREREWSVIERWNQLFS
ncbi:MAG: histidine phosphatase family protein [Solirubrobacteraceae bacterium]